VIVGDAVLAGLARLTPQDRDALTAYAARASWPAGFVIYQRGTPADGLFVVISGRIVLRSRVRAGRGFVPWIATPGETFGSEGLSQNGKYVTDARADEESETLFLSGARFRAFVREQPQQALSLVGQMMAERSALLDKLRELTTLSVEQRLVTTLLRMSSDGAFTRDDGRVVLSSARYRLLCELVGATRESVSLVLARLAGEGLVERQGSTMIVAPPQRLIERFDASSDTDLVLAGLADVADGAGSESVA
jgi:CRP/FNR family transcriptional regulator, cyclic AMP receptor protein